MSRHISLVVVVSLAGLAACATLAGAAWFERCSTGKCNPQPQQTAPLATVLDRIAKPAPTRAVEVTPPAPAPVAATPTHSVLVPAAPVSQALPATTMETRTPAAAMQQSLPARTMETRTAPAAAATAPQRVILRAPVSRYNPHRAYDPPPRRGLFRRWR